MMHQTLNKQTRRRLCFFGWILAASMAMAVNAPAAATKDGSPAESSGTIAAPIPDTIETVAGSSTNAARMGALARWQEARFGLFLHWGVYSVYGGTYQGKELWSAEWIQENARIPWTEYSQTAAHWNPSDFNAEAWVKVAKAAGMRYVVLTAKHHDGFAMYPSKASKYNLLDWTQYRGPDPLAALKAACHKNGLMFGIYYSPLEFRISPNGFRPEDEKAIAAGFSYRTLGPKPYASNADVVKLAKAQIKELAEDYQPDIFWFDGTWDKMGVWTEADAQECEAAIRAAVPNVLVNNRLGVKAVDFKTYENNFPKSVQREPWEYCWNLGTGSPKASLLGDPSGKTLRTENKDGRWLVYPDLATPIKPFAVIVLAVGDKLDLQSRH
jgi:alpha-L-fucosidase